MTLERAGWIALALIFFTFGYQTGKGCAPPSAMSRHEAIDRELRKVKRELVQKAQTLSAEELKRELLREGADE